MSDNVNWEECIVEEEPRLNIFSDEQKWFRHEKYEIGEYKGRVYIKPARHAQVHEYNPYEEYPEILKDFFSIVMDKMINKVVEERGSGNSGITIGPVDPVSKREAYQLHIDCATILLEFYNKYGPLGIFFEDLLAIDAEENGHILVYLKKEPVIGKNYSYYMFEEKPDTEHSHVYQYENYARIYFPWHPRVPKLFEETDSIERLYGRNYNLSPDFTLYYSEEVSLILLNELLLKLLQITVTLKELDQGKTQSPLALGHGNLFLDTSFPGVSQPIINSYKMTLMSDGKNMRIGWKANSLLGILALLFVENLTKQRNDNLKLCKLAGCARLAAGRAEYCSNKHGAVYRKRKSRKNLEAKKLLEQYKQQSDK